jgi:hypothetical protein
MALPQDSPQDIPPDIGKLQSEMNARVKAHWKAFLFEGIVLALLGFAAMIVPPLASLAVGLLVGINLVLGGASLVGMALAAQVRPPIVAVTRPAGCAIERAMIMIVASNFWYFSYDSSLAVGGSRSI